MTLSLDCSGDWEFSRDQASWEKVLLPHTAALEPETVSRQWEGVCYYRLAFTPPPEWDGRVVNLEIGAAMQVARIHVNGHYQFTHFGGYQRFLVPLNGRLASGRENTVLIELDNRPCADVPPAKPLRDLDFCYYGGLYRKTRFLVAERVHISDELGVNVPAGGGVFIRTEQASADAAVVSARAHVVNDTPLYDAAARGKKNPGDWLVEAELRCFGPDGSDLGVHAAAPAGILPNCDHVFEWSLPVAAPKHWRPDAPNLYRAEFVVRLNGRTVDTRSERFGIRTIAFTKDGFYLNGEKTVLTGTNRHQEYPFVGNALPENAHRRDARLIKNAGFNWVRLCHYPQDRSFVDACDELGLMVMAPIPGWQKYETNEHFVNNALRDCRELVRTLRNHPSVILWEASLNETMPPSWLNRLLHRAVHEEYPGPGCYTCGDTLGHFEEWDVPFYGETPMADKPVVMREYGDWTFGGNESTSRVRRGAQPADLLRQAWNFQWSLNRARNTPNLVATADWAMFDYNRGYHEDTERSGSMDLYRLPKPKYFFYQSQCPPEPMAFIAPGDGKVVVFSDCEEVELFVDGRPVARRTPDDGPDSPYTADGRCPGWNTMMLGDLEHSGGNPYDGGNARQLAHPPFTFMNVDPRGAALEAVGYRGGREVARHRLPVPGPAARVAVRVRDEGVPVAADDLVFVDALLLDADGNGVSDATDSVSFEVSGAAYCGGTERFEAGIASALLRITQPGRVRIAVRTESLGRDTEIEITADTGKCPDSL